MRRQQVSETHKPGRVTRIINGTKVTEERAEIQVQGADAQYSKIRIVNFLRDGSSLHPGDAVDVAFKSEDVEPKREH